MRSQRPEGYGRLGWFVQEYSNVSDDPWGLTWRPSQAFRYQRILRLLLTIPGIHPSVMDIGCATGDFTDLLSKRISQAESVLGVDFVESAVARARQRFPHINFVRASISSLAETYDRQFDVVSCLEVLYYLERDQQSQALKSIKRVLRNKGYAIFSSFISTPPYFTTAQLMDLISCEFEVVATEVLHLKIINFVEMIGRRVDKLALMISGGKVNGVAARIFGRVPFSTVGALEKLSKSISVRSASHTIVLARVVD